MVKIIYADITNYKYNESDIECLCEARKDYVQSISNKKRKLQSLVVWKLLMQVLREYSDSMQFHFSNENGKWIESSGKVKFSLTHSNNIVAVAIADNNVGIDVEMFSEKILMLKDKFLVPENENELVYLARKWTEKESSFKKGGMGNFFSFEISDDVSNKYLVTVCSDDNNFDFKKLIINLNKI